MVDNSHKARQLEKVVRLDTYPLAVKLLRSERDIPEEAKRPVRDFGYHLSLCQVFSMSRREGTAIAVLKEDMWCFEPVLAFGLEKPPVRFLQGHNRFPRDVRHWKPEPITRRAPRAWKQVSISESCLRRWKLQISIPIW